MHEDHGGKSILLARTGGLGEISMCGCGVISLHLGSVTLRLESTALLEVDRMIQEALRNLCELAVVQRHDERAAPSIQ